MQNIWTRVARMRRSCRCPQCLHAAQGVARRAGTANANSNAITPKYWTSSTLWYSGIFAAAATFDAGVKQKRREQWDQAIEHVKQELRQAVDVDQKLAPRDSAGHATPNCTGDALNLGVDGLPEVNAESYAVKKHFTTSSTDKALQGSVIPRADSHETHPTFTSAYAPLDPETQWKEDIRQYVDSSIGRRKRAKWPSNTGANLNVFHLPPQSIYATAARKRRADALPWTEKKLKIVEMETELLLMTFFAWLRHREAKGLSCEDAACAVPPEFADKIRRYVKLTRDEFYGAVKLKAADVARRMRAPDEGLGQIVAFQRNIEDEQFCNYIQDGLGEYRSVQSDMNTAIRSLFDQADNKLLEAPQYLAKVFYNLSASTAPPNIDTYNTLITRMHPLGHTLLTRSTIISFLKAYLRPNEVSLAAIMNFRTDTDDPEGFRYFVERMNGAGKRGEFLMSAAPWTTKPKNGRFYYGNRTFAREDGRMVQKPFPTPMVFTALLRGVLRFDGFDEVLRVTQAWAKDGWGLDVHGFSMLLKDCADRGDWTAGLAVWRQIEYLQSRWSVRPGKVSLWTLADMLQLCNLSGDREEFNRVIDLALKSHETQVRSGILTNLVKKRRVEIAAKRIAEKDDKAQDYSAAEGRELPSERKFNVFKQFHEMEAAEAKLRAKPTSTHLEKDDFRENEHQQPFHNHQRLSIIGNHRNLRKP
ncbi:hypothetical protein AC579_858 [Pseudocercospora musae]|uniref:Uncharacterized protein n=1 Tax=Pseudocercospora musae TaxID=113226 RepID=A0A139HI92_9PEZI|nr:hypothetical protein AC579_858 [Pseudocercospora musae]